MKLSAVFLLMCLVSVTYAGAGGEALAITVIVPIEEAKLDELLNAREGLKPS